MKHRLVDGVRGFVGEDAGGQVRHKLSPLGEVGCLLGYIEHLIPSRYT